MLRVTGVVFRFVAVTLLLASAAACSRDPDDDDDDETPGPFEDPLPGAWVDGFGLPGPSGAGAQVFAAVTSGGVTYVGGIFEQVGDTPARNIAAWDGTTWTQVGDGLPGAVYALAFDATGALVAGGDPVSFDVPNRLHAFDGVSWTELPGDVNGQVRALARQGGDLLVGGGFDDAGGSGANSIARFDGVTWTSLSGAGLFGQVDAIGVVDADTFCVGGSIFNVDGADVANVACNDAGTWSQLGDGLNGAVHALVQDGNGDWLAGGNFDFLIDADLGIFLFSLARLDAGTWEPLAGGVYGGSINDVRAIVPLENGDVLVGGSFQAAGSGSGDVPASNIARLSAGGAWSEVGGGVFNRVGFFIPGASGINVIVPLGSDDVLVGGGVFSHAGETVVSNLAVSTNGTFVATVPAGPAIRGLSGFADALGFDADGNVLAGGSFQGAGHLPVNNVARMRDGVWETLGGGIDGIVRSFALLPDGTVIAAGEFSGLRRFVDGDWETFATGVADVFTLAVAEDGDIYAGGNFDEYIKRWDGEAWRSMDGGFDDEGGTINPRPSTLGFDDRGRLVVGGHFRRSVSGEQLNGIARWSSGEWHAYGTGLGGEANSVSDVAIVGGDLVIAGSFTEVGGATVTSLARWDGEAWHPVGGLFPDNFGAPPSIVDVEPYGPAGFFVTGTFTELPGGTAARYIAWFDGTSYHPLGEGLSDLAEELDVRGTTLWAGGTFVEAGGRVSSGIAAWDFTP